MRVIIPTRNEAQALPALLHDLQAQRGVPLRITVADGGSTDSTVAQAQAAGASVLHSAPGRGRQLNTALQASTEPHLLFLHADSRLPNPDLLRTALAAWQASATMRTAGHFRLCFYDAPQPKPRFYQHLEAKSALNRRHTFNGDQGLLIHRSFLQVLGGFAEQLPFLEDQALGDAVHAQGQWMTLPGTLHTSARRFEAEGRGERYFLMMAIMCLREAGCDDVLARLPALYRAQEQIDGRLNLQPLVAALLEEVQKVPDFWPRMADFTLANAWQPAAWLDSRAHAPGRWLGRYDRHLAPRLQRLPAARRVLTPILRVGFGGLLPRYLRWRQRRAPTT